MGVPAQLLFATPWTVAILTAEILSAIMTSGKNELQISNQTLVRVKGKADTGCITLAKNNLPLWNKS